MRVHAPLLVLLVLLAGCGGPPARAAGTTTSPTVRDGWLEVERPAIATVTFESADRWPSGTRIVVVEGPEDGAARRVLVPGFDAAGAPSLDSDGETVLFTGRRMATDPYEVWSCRLDGSGLRRRVPGPADAGVAAWLPDGRIVLARAQPGPAPTVMAASPWALAVAAGDGTAPETITFGAGLDADPALLPDGRILYASWTPPAPGAEAAAGRHALLAVHPDGSGAAVHHGADVGPAVKARPRAKADGSVVYRDAPAGGGRWLVDPRAPLEAPRALEAAGAGRVPLAPPPRPQGHLSMVRAEQDHGRLLVIDARPGGATGALAVRVEALAGPWSRTGPPVARSLGEAPLAPDGSVFVTLPADVPLLLSVVDGKGALLHRDRRPFWVRPNESRGRTGCLEHAQTTPPNVRPQAVLQPPVHLHGAGEDDA